MALYKAFFLFLISVSICIQTGIYSQSYDYRDADKLFSEEKFEEAAKIYLQLAENNPYNGYFWDNYAFCMYQLKNYDKAIENFKRAIDAGYNLSACSYNIACCYSLMNNPEMAVEWLKKSAGYKYTALENSVTNDKDFDQVRNTELFKKEILPVRSEFKNRAEGWKTDLMFMKNRMEETHYDLFANITRQKWDAMFENLSGNIDGMDDSQIFTEMLKITASAGDAHTTIFPGDNNSIKLNTMPLQFFLFEDGLYVTLASPEYKELAGKKVLKIGNQTPEGALKKLKEVVSLDNEIWLKAAGMNYLTYLNVLYGLEIIPNPNEAELIIEGGEKFTVKPVTAEGHMHSERSGWIKGRDTLNQPLYLKNRSELYWYEYLPNSKLVYMQFNGVANKKEESLKEFSKRVFDFIDSNDVNYFVLDIRFNSGGNNFLNQSLVQEIIKCDKINKNGNFFTITGRNTFSAAMNLCNDIERQTRTIFAGEPTGSKPNFTGESNMILLPYSGLRVSCSSRRWQGTLSDDYRKWIAPQLGVKYYFSDYKNGVDPAMDEILKFISK